MILLALHFVAHLLLLIRIAFHVFVEGAYCQLRAAHQRILMVADDGLGAGVLLLLLALVRQHRRSVAT